jgi:hypothetical protein
VTWRFARFSVGLGIEPVPCFPARQALSLDRSELRQAQLTELANRALRLLRSSNATVQVEKLCSSGNPLGVQTRKM